MTGLLRRVRAAVGVLVHGIDEGPAIAGGVTVAADAEIVNAVECCFGQVGLWSLWPTRATTAELELVAAAVACARLVRDEEWWRFAAEIEGASP